MNQVIRQLGAQKAEIARLKAELDKANQKVAQQAKQITDGINERNRLWVELGKKNGAYQ